ncbi:DMT family transporter [Salinarimonas ramus]|uniref:Membrane protein n=1 Tax=Salinarimonas ramus TaxID=690164 RepID=A0A917Q7B3_9HYPH|nr:DMT family transporter [Salinarimonas ramus]GGK32496.1 membrane protein [Salinarimonas ramus]
MRSNELGAYAAAVVTLSLWASSFVGIRVALETWTPGGLALLRYVVAAGSLLCLLPFLDLGDRMKPNRADVLMFSAFALLGVVGYHVGLNIGEQTVTAATASFLVAQIPLVTLVLNAALFGERLTPVRATGLVVGLSGTGMILVGEAEGLSIDFGVLWIVMAIVSESLYFIYQKRALSRFTPFGLNFYTTLFAVVFMAPFLLDLTVAGAVVDAAAIGVVVYLGIFPAAVAYLLWSYAINALGASRTAATLYALPLVTIAMGFVLIGELPTTLAMLGGGIALSGAYLCSREPRT